MFKENKIETSEHKIVLMDQRLNDPINDPEGIACGKKLDKKNTEKHYYYLNKLINNLSNMYNKEVIVCLHPGDNLEIKKKYFPNLEVVKYQTKENIYKIYFFEIFTQLIY